MSMNIIPTEEHPIDKSGIEALLSNIRPVWQGKSLISRVERLLPVDASSACQRLFNAAIHDLKQKIIVIGSHLAKEVALNYKLPPITKEDDILDYNVSKTIDLAYRIGILTRSEWRRIHRCYEIRRDLEHEDDEYEAVLEDCFYIFKSAIDIILSRDPIELLKVTDVKEVIESSTNVTPTEEFLDDYRKAPKIRQKEISELLISYSYDNNKPDIVRENSIELLRSIRVLTDKTVTIDLAKNLEKRLGRDELNLITAKVGHACGAIGYFKKVKLKDFYKKIEEELVSSLADWDGQERICTKLEDVGGLVYCPEEFYLSVLKNLVLFYIGETSYGQWKNYRPVFYSDSAAPIILRLIVQDKVRAGKYIDELREHGAIKRSIGNVSILRRFENIVDQMEIEETN